MNGKVPVAGMVLVLGIDRFTSKARAITNLFGNAVASIFVAWWEGMLDLPKARAILDRPEGVEPAVLAEQGR
jgi:aerobic C4-dicarboxylate transport protein